ARTYLDFDLLRKSLMEKKVIHVASFSNLPFHGLYLVLLMYTETRCSPSYINGMVTHLESITTVEKLLEIDTIGFGFVKRIPKWSVKQSIMKQLAFAYDVDTNTLIVDVGNICINSELIGKALGIRDG
ncbi:hypothetical protein S245_040074, partial [Arachis hypogaea]